ncbi:proline and serine-rich protein 2-like [Pongo pygmaeus]|uniref:proline and serine-rich protein 2-like n=1 Tax=Pongo pygmaeus TaxID=9600 RepID=UPI00300C179D
MALAGNPGLPGFPPAPSRASAPGHLPLASEPRRQGRKNKSGSAARPSEEEAPLPAPTRQVCRGEPGRLAAPAAQRGGAPGGRGTEPRGAGPWASRGGAGLPTACVRLRASLALPRGPGLAVARASNPGAGIIGLHRVRLPPAISVIKAGNSVEDAFPWNDPEWTTPELSLPILATSKAIIPLKTMASFGTKRK